jgi:hypothetical protein
MSYASSFAFACNRLTTSCAPLRYMHKQMSEPSVSMTAQYLVLPYRAMRMALYSHPRITRIGRARSPLPCPVGCYLPLHQPWGVLCDHQAPFSPLRSFICTPCLLHQPSGGACSPLGSSAAGKRLSNASSRASKRCSSLSRKVTCTVQPARVTWTFTLAGASGRARAGSA